MVVLLIKYHVKHSTVKVNKKLKKPYHEKSYF